MHKLVGKAAPDFSSKELGLLLPLADELAELAARGGKQAPQMGIVGCSERIMSALQDLVTALDLEPLSREYLRQFSGLYSFSGCQGYKVGVLRASMSLTPVVWVNGEAFQQSPEMMQHAEVLNSAWLSVWNFLSRLLSAGCGPRRGRDELRGHLLALDAAWVAFEEPYLAELLRMQRHARHMVLRAVKEEQCLRSAEGRSDARAGGGSTALDEEAQVCRVRECRCAELRLLDYLERLHEAVTSKCRTRSPEQQKAALDAARAHLADGRRGSARAPDLAVLLARRVSNSYQDLRDFLERVHDHFDELNPLLCKNAGLADRLTSWQDSLHRWEHYAQSPGMLAAVRQLGRSLWFAQKVAPGLRHMCEHYEAELFLALPRLACLCLFSDPSGPLGALAEAFLPHRLGARPQGDAGVAGPADAAPQLPSGVQGVAADLQCALAAVASCLAAGGPAGAEGRPSGRPSDLRAAAWEVLVRRSVAGTCGRAGAEDPYAGLERPWREAAARSVEAFMNRLEGWSMELQRHSPEAWNELSGLLVQCIQWRPCAARRAPAKFTI